jgi:predicted O-methyltransferase YrrM
MGIKELASNVPLGTCIVELGTSLGLSAVFYSQVVKSGVQIFTFDDYDYARINWLGGTYDPNSERICLKNIAEANANIILCRIKIEDAVKRWIRSIGLVSWDIGQPNRFREDFEDWSKFVITGGVVIVRDMPNNHFGTFEVIDELVESSRWEKFNYVDGVSFLRRME